MMQLIKQLLKSNFLRILAIGYSLFVTVIMLVPITKGPKVNIPFFDKIVHALLYFLFAIIWLFYFRSLGKESKSIYVFVSIALFIYGIIIEVLQGSYIVTRTHDNWDIVANATGIIIGVLVFYKAKDTFLSKK
ncbi:VanZ family protein [Aureisphaera sp. CAU 1614]|uniref:VanZ family protein n=1 Tax=Halomarinibacterium sedimenti TaxID=2857106 RepID=A0A9X1FRR9_9FLAO|nr:VanZ family protein [Halomarinibacterium sedimenti]MBW2938637.1 VanZ family protein [Halomarinibacterium sedimenti]